MRYPTEVARNSRKMTTVCIATVIACRKIELNHVEHLADGLDAVRNTLGSAEQSGFSDDYVKETLFHYYYDVDQTINYLLGECYCTANAGRY